MRRIYHIITHFDLGGAEKVALNICKSQSKKFDYHIFEVVKSNSKFSEFFIKDIKDSQITYHRSIISNKKIGLIFFSFYFFFYCLFRKPHIIHTHTEIPDLSIFLYQKIANLFSIKNKYVRTIHNNKIWSDWGNLGKYVECFFQESKANVAISESVKENYFQEYMQKDILVINNGVKPTEQQSFESIKRNKINILFAGRLEKQKGVDELIKVIIRLVPNQHLHFHIIGNGSLKDKIDKQLGGLNNTSIYESIYNLSRYLSSFDFLFMPSNFEGLSILTLEASFQRLPSIINNCNGLKETLPKDWPLKVEGNNVDEYIYLFNEKIKKINRADIGNLAYDFVNSKFTVECMQKAYEKIYEAKYY